MRTTAAIALAAFAGSAAGELTITEIWAGSLPGSEATADWFEVTNFGDSDFDFSGVFYDDSSNDPTVNDPIAGIASIAAGESVVVLTSWEDDFDTAADAVAAFVATWGEIAGLQIGWVEGGAGLGGDGDAAFVYDGNTVDANTLASAEYFDEPQPASFIFNPETGEFGELAQVGVFGAFESLVPASSSILDLAVASPGAVPAPATAALLGLAGLAATRRR